MCPLFHTKPITKQFYTSARSHCFTISFSDESKEEEVGHLLTKEEEDVKVMQSWMEVGGLSSPSRGGSKGTSSRGKFIPWFPIPPSSLHLSPNTDFFPHNFCISFLLAVSFSSFMDYSCFSGLARRERRHKS